MTIGGVGRGDCGWFVAGGLGCFFLAGQRPWWRTCWAVLVLTFVPLVVSVENLQCAAGGVAGVGGFAAGCGAGGFCAGEEGGAGVKTGNIERRTSNTGRRTGESAALVLSVLLLMAGAAFGSETVIVPYDATKPIAGQKPDQFSAV